MLLILLQSQSAHCALLAASVSTHSQDKIWPSLHRVKGHLGSHQCWIPQLDTGATVVGSSPPHEYSKAFGCEEGVQFIFGLEHL
jgi:hypothetical protein